ncbi:hypothetical protein GCM10022225_81810 [Plantactinospora mayteni]|uniref:Integral membrane protein n=1 Tax=Plantactinospora mayteni TaxID=566021 RepID=A0ABQ4ETK5_9ACTN|nr:hypothetical protein [Plantactinospora mayteni]GIG97997.1 hypothetical protein Pma05_45700 [Plantactinospora mayteni]
MSSWLAVRAWAAVHRTRPASGVTVLVASASIFFARTTIEDFGLIRLLTPVSVMLLLPAIAAVGAAIGCVNAAQLPLPDPPRAVAARLTWAVGWAGLAILAANLGQFAGADAQWSAVTRNALLYLAVGLAMIRFGRAHLIWLPVVAYTVVCMVFGYPSGEPRYYWWAVVMQEHATVGQLVGVGCVFSVGLLTYLLPRPGGLSSALPRAAVRVGRG